MLTHDYFEEICAAASIGQATGEELAQLEQHAAECTRCQQAYIDCLNVAAQQFARAKQNPTLSAKEMEECIDSNLFVRRFIDRAEREGINFSCEVGKTVKPPARITFGLPNYIDCDELLSGDNEFRGRQLHLQHRRQNSRRITTGGAIAIQRRND